MKVQSTNNLFVTSKNETTISPIHEFKVLPVPDSHLNLLFNGVYFLFITLKNILSLAFSFERHFAAL